MNDSAINPPDYAPPVNQLLSLEQPQGHDFTLDYAALGITTAHVPELLRMVADGELHNASSDNELVWAPVHAWRALAQLKAASAVTPLLDLLPRIDKHNDDWVSAEVPRVLGEIGHAALEPVTAHLADATHDDWARVAAARTLAELGTRHPDLRTECVARLSAQLEKCADQSGTLNGCLVSPLLDLKAHEALPVIERAFAGGHVDESVAGDYEDVEIELGLKAQRQHPRKPNALTELGDKLRALAARDQSMNDMLDEAIGADGPRPYAGSGKPGRNDPCPCGSGKKYKKCCGKP